MPSERIPLSEPYLAGNARRYLEECIDTNFVSSVGPFVERFEREVADYVGARYAVACASGTAALHVALRLVGIGVGDEVFVSSFTFIASANPIVYLGGTPVLVDSESTTWNLDPGLVIEELEARIRRGAPLPKAVEVVHVLGHPADLEALLRICIHHGIAVIEDAAEALGATFTTGSLAGRHVGTIGRLGCFSFNGNKIITTGGGGMIVTDDATLARMAKHLTTQARVAGRGYFHDEVGFNYRLTNLAAALGVAQLEELDGFLVKKAALAQRYDAAFQGCAGITLPPRASFAQPSHWLYSILFENSTERDAVLDRLNRAGIEARPLWTPLHLMPPYRKAEMLGDGLVSEGLAARGLSLPSSVQLSMEQQSRVIDLVLKGFQT